MKNTQTQQGLPGEIRFFSRTLEERGIDAKAASSLMEGFDRAKYISADLVIERNGELALKGTYFGPILPPFHGSRGDKVVDYLRAQGFNTAEGIMHGPLTVRLKIQVSGKEIPAEFNYRRV